MISSTARLLHEEPTFARLKRLALAAHIEFDLHRNRDRSTPRDRCNRASTRPRVLQIVATEAGPAAAGVLFAAVAVLVRALVSGP